MEEKKMSDKTYGICQAVSSRRVPSWAWGMELQAGWAVGLCDSTCRMMKDCRGPANRRAHGRRGIGPDWNHAVAQAVMST